MHKNAVSASLESIWSKYFSYLGLNLRINFIVKTKHLQLYWKQFVPGDLENEKEYCYQKYKHLPVQAPVMCSRPGLAKHTNYQLQLHQRFGDGRGRCKYYHYNLQ